MKFIEKHLNKHHLLHKPHRWFLAFLSSPIHFAEMHYKKKYHLNFKHAKKLFVFDILLLLTTILLFSATIFWYNYNPDITDQIDLSIQTNIDRIISGDYVTYNISYKNNSEITLKNSIIFINLPRGFVIDEITPKNNFDERNHSFKLNNIVKNQAENFQISGWYYDTPNQETHVTVEMLYNQPDRKNTETKLTNLIQIHRGSTLQGSIEMSTQTLTQSTLPIKIKLKNTGERSIENIILPLNLESGLTVSDYETSAGKIENLQWSIEKLDPNEEVELNALFQTNLPENLNQKSFELLPKIIVNNETIDQETISHKLNILHPKVNLETYWKDNVLSISPGEEKTLILKIKNEGNIELKNLKIDIPLLKNIINIEQLVYLNTGKLQQENFITDSNFLANLKKITPGNSAEISLKIPIKKYPYGGTDLSFSLEPKIEAGVVGISGSTFLSTATTPEIKVGSYLSFKPELRYYTDENDQLGRGPLPPQIGKETKYWLLFEMQNGTSKISNLQFSAKLPDYIKWTGKSSVSRGADIKLSQTNHTAYWSLNSLDPNEKVGIYFELSLTPSPKQLGSTPNIIQNINISTFDNFINKKLEYNTGAIDISLPFDKIGQNKGVYVKN